MKCYSCDAELAEAANFCGFCGADQSKRPVKGHSCISCGFEIEPGALFCSNCGAAQNQPSPEIFPEPTEPETPLSDPQEPATEAPVQEAIPALSIDTPSEAEPAHISATTPAPEPAPMQQNCQNPYQPGYRPNPYQPAYQPQQYIPFDINSAMPQRPTGAVFQATQQPAYQLPSERGLLKMFLLSLLTLGIYPVVIYSRIAEEINMVASRHDGQRTMPFLFMCMLAPLTLMIYPFVWIHGLCSRMGAELQRRQINYKFSAISFWLWNLVYGFVGSLITGIAVYVLYAIIELAPMMVILSGSALLIASTVGPCIFIHKMMKAMNLINTDYNRRG